MFFMQQKKNMSCLIKKQTDEKDINGFHNTIIYFL